MDTMLATSLVVHVILVAGMIGPSPQGRWHSLEAASGLDLRNVLAESSEHRGKKAVRIVEAPGEAAETMAILPDSDFGDGTIELELAGQVRAGAPEGSRGFVGVAFRVDPTTLAYDCFYLRPENGRADDQLRRNHSTQYISHPDLTWDRLRKEQPVSTRPTSIWSAAPGRACASSSRVATRASSSTEPSSPRSSSRT